MKIWGVTDASVKTSLNCLFLQFNIDMLAAMQTRPTESWTSIAERECRSQWTV